MKKCICLLLAALLLLSLAACGQKAAAVDVQAQADAFATNCTFDSPLSPVDAEELSFYFTLPENTEIAGYMADGTSTEMVVCANCKTEADAAALHENFQDYLAEQAEQASRYQPEEVDRICNGGRTFCNKTNVIVLVCTDSETVNKMFEEYAK